MYIQKKGEVSLLFSQKSVGCYVDVTSFITHISYRGYICFRGATQFLPSDRIKLYSAVFSSKFLTTLVTFID